MPSYDAESFAPPAPVTHVIQNAREQVSAA